MTREIPGEVGDSSSLPNLKRFAAEEVDGVGGSDDDSFSWLRVVVTRCSRRVYAMANVMAKSSTG